MKTESSERYRPVWAEIYLERLKHNMREVRRLVGPRVKVFAVVKADAYGHGAERAAGAFLEAGADFLAVALPEEGIELRNAGFQVPILVFGPYVPGQGRAFADYGLTASLASTEALEDLSAYTAGRKMVVPVHVKIDTGMGRVGVQTDQAVNFFKAVAATPGLRLEGAYTHMARADEFDKASALAQYGKFVQATGEAMRAGIQIPLRHMANSAGIIDLPETYLDAVRPGIMIYGLYPSEEVHKERVTLQPAMELKARVSHVKRVPAGTPVSYGGTYRALQETNIATVPIGYADGYSRILNGRGAEVVIQGRRFPQVGRICMDQIMIDVGDAPVRIGDEVVLFGHQGDEFIHTDEVARKLGTINYEVTCMVSKRVPRVEL